jgi:hypothetical protein
MYDDKQLLQALSMIATPGYVSPDLTPADAGRLSPRQAAWLHHRLVKNGVHPQANTPSGRTWRLEFEDHTGTCKMTLVLSKLGGTVEVWRCRQWVDYTYTQEVDYAD